MEKVAGRVGLAIALLVALVGYLLLAYWLLTPYIEPYAAYWRGETSPIPNGWAALTPYYAWPVLVAYGGALVLAVICIAVQAGRLTVRRQRRDADKRHDDAMQEARRRTEDAKQIRQQGEAMQQEARAAMEEVARREKEADEQVEKAEFRLGRSVDTNIGLHRQIQKLKKRPE